MKPKKREISKNGKKKWEVDFGLDDAGVRRRPYFDTEAEADDEIKKYKKDEKAQGDYLARLPAPQRRMVAAVLMEIKAAGLALADVWSQCKAHKQESAKQSTATAMGYADVVAEFRRR
jgi:hypothetical protein